MAAPVGGQETCPCGTQPSAQGGRGLPSAWESGDPSASGRERPSRATGCPGSCVSQGENDCLSVERSGHTAWGESGRWPSPPGDASTALARMLTEEPACSGRGGWTWGSLLLAEVGA